MASVDLAGVVDSREAQGREVADRCKTRWFAGIDDVLTHVDGAVIAVPTCFHLEVARRFLDARVPVLIEKPLADSLDAARTLQRLAALRQTTLQVGHVERFNPAFEILQQRCGKPLYIRSQRLSPYAFRSMDIGVVHDLMIHDLDLVLTLTGESVDSVDSFGAVTIGPHEDMAVARLRTRSGILIDLTASRMHPTAERTLQVWSREGFTSADLHQRTVKSWKPVAPLAANPAMVHDVIAATPNPLTLKDEVFSKWITHEEIQGGNSDALAAELQDFVKAISTGTTPRVTGDDAVRAMEVADRILDGMPKHSWQPDSRLSRAA
jgi:predicted dehydrogenase